MGQSEEPMRREVVLLNSELGDLAFTVPVFDVETPLCGQLWNLILKENLLYEDLHTLTSLNVL